MRTFDRIRVSPTPRHGSLLTTSPGVRLLLERRGEVIAQVVLFPTQARHLVQRLLAAEPAYDPEASIQIARVGHYVVVQEPFDWSLLFPARYGHALAGAISHCLYVLDQGTSASAHADIAGQYHDFLTDDQQPAEADVQKVDWPHEGF